MTTEEHNEYKGKLRNGLTSSKSSKVKEMWYALTGSAEIAVNRVSKKNRIYISVYDETCVRILCRIHIACVSDAEK